PESVNSLFIRINYMQPKFLNKINQDLGVFFMRFSKQDKINIYLLYQKGYPYSKVRQYYPIDESNFYYLIQMLNRYGVSWLDRPRHKWTKEEKMEAIDRVLINHEIGRSVALDLGLSSAGMLFNW